MKNARVACLAWMLLANPVRSEPSLTTRLGFWARNAGRDHRKRGNRWVHLRARQSRLDSKRDFARDSLRAMAHRQQRPVECL